MFVVKLFSTEKQQNSYFHSVECARLKKIEYLSNKIKGLTNNDEIIEISLELNKLSDKDKWRQKNLDEYIQRAKDRLLKQEIEHQKWLLEREKNYIDLEKVTFLTTEQFYNF